MPASTRPAPSRPTSPCSAQRPRSAPLLAEPVPSDGLTLDTRFGTVDLVAVHRAVSGDPSVTLTFAEQVWIYRRQRNGARRDAAHALGTGYTGLLKALARHRRHLDPFTASDLATAAMCPF